MARPRSFDRDHVLDQALRAFWRCGYEATSVQTLVDAMGISRASLYNAFGSKHDLFIEVLKHYEAQRMEGLIDRLRDPSTSASVAIRGVLEAAGPSGAAARRGCLMTNTATEMCVRDAECAERVQANFERLTDAFAAAIERGQDAGALPADRDSRATARYLTNALQGVRVMTAVGMDGEAIDDIVNVTMQVISD
jgi:TetR/AcrR family transcriptional repressor of nem operon